MKRMMALILALVMALSLIACGGSAPEKKEETETPAAAEPAQEEQKEEAPAEEPKEEAPAEAAEGNGEKLVVGFAQIGQESGWRDAETADIQKYAGENTDTIELIFADAQQKQENQIKAIKNFIEMKVDVIAMAPVVETGWEAVLTEAKEAGIPVILVDRGIDASMEDLYACQISSDFIQEGANAAVEVAKLLNDKGSIVELEGTVGASAANDRKTGFDEKIAEYPDITILASQTGDFTRAGGKEVMESFLKTYDDINAVYAHNDDMALGAIEAIKEAGLKPGEDIKVVSIDGVRGAFEAMVNGELNVTLECNPCLGKQLFETAQALKNGEEVEKWIKSEEGIFRQETAAVDIESRTY